MCSIVGSFSIDTLRELVDANAYRGQYRHSVMAITPGLEIKHLFQGVGAFDKYELFHETLDPMYYIAHHQAPTSASADYHPAWHNDDFLYHNGIVKERYIPELQKMCDSLEQWDTRLLCQAVHYKGLGVLSDIDGTYACIMRYKTQLYAFRNQLSPLFTNDKMDFSSTKTPLVSDELPSEEVFELNLQGRSTKSIFNFGTKDDVYFFG